MYAKEGSCGFRDGRSGLAQCLLRIYETQGGRQNVLAFCLVPRCPLLDLPDLPWPVACLINLNWERGGSKREACPLSIFGGQHMASVVVSIQKYLSKR